MSEKLEKQEHEASLYEGLKQMTKGRLDDQRGLEINGELPDFLKTSRSRISEKQGSADVKEKELSEDERAKVRELKLSYLNTFTANSDDSVRQKLQRLGDDPHFDIFPTIPLFGSESPLAEEWKIQLDSAQTKNNILDGI